MTEGAPTEEGRRRVGLVIGSGGIKCAASLGLWKALKREGIEVDLVVGCSGGSIFAAFMALGIDVDETERWLLDRWTGSIAARPNVLSFLKILLPTLLRFDETVGLVDDRRLVGALRDAFGEATFAETVVPLYLAATDIHDGERVVLDSGPIADAVRASIAIPVLFRPWPVGGRLLVDGGASDPLPVSVAMREGADVIVAMGFENTYDPHLSTIFRLINQNLMITVNHLLRSTYSFYSLAHHAEIVPIMPVFDRPLFLGDVDAFPYVIEMGEKTAEEHLPYLVRLLESG